MVLERYSTPQRLCFAGLVIGFLLCVIGAIPNKWVYGELSINDGAKLFDINIPFIGDTSVFKVESGLWWQCYTVDVLLDKGTECEAYNFDGNIDAAVLARGCCLVNILLALLCALAACCRGCCCQGGRTICHGIMAFLSGGAGIATLAMYVTHKGNGGGDFDDIVAMLVQERYGWALYVYGAGSGLITLISFLLCFLTPESQLGYVIPGQATSTYVHLQEANTMNQQGPGMQQAAAYPGAGYPTLA